MIKIKYCDYGEPISDFKVFDYVDSVINNYESDLFFIVETSSELCLMTFGLRVLEGRLPIEEVEFYFQGCKLDFDPFLGLLGPDDFGFFYQVSNKALQIGFQKKREQAKKGIKHE